MNAPYSYSFCCRVTAMWKILDRLLLADIGLVTRWLRLDFKYVAPP